MSRNLANGYSQVSLRSYGDFILTVEVWEKGTRRALMQRRIDEAHDSNEGGEHRSGFCRACADLYVSLCQDKADALAPSDLS